MTYEVKRIHEPVRLDAVWNKPFWDDVPALELKHHMGKKPEHFPRTQAKLVYDDEALYVIFRVEDQYVRAAAEKHQDSVCVDSCVEFFFTPHTDVKKGYFNLEMNCGGTILFNHQLIPWKEREQLKLDELAKIEVAHSMPKRIEEEITEPTTWTVEYRLPFEILIGYDADLKQPAPGVHWPANFYKCADATSHPHWLTWNEVDKPSPNFHVPEYFGTLLFK